jgi:hypothetical protein
MPHQQFIRSDFFLIFRLDTPTMFKIREWERFQFAIDYQNQQVRDIICRMHLICADHHPDAAQENS